MIPDGELIAYGSVQGWRERVKSPYPEDLLNAYEVAGIALNDGTKGLQVRQWFARVIYQESPEAWLLQVGHDQLPWLTILERSAEVTEIDLAFDNNMRVFLVWVEDDQAYIHWYDTDAVDMVTTTLPADARTPRCCIDDKRSFNSSNSDIILTYLRGEDLYYRQQRDRYQTEHLLAEGLGEDAIIVCLGMSSQYRLQWRLRHANLIALATPAERPFLSDIVTDLLRRSAVPVEHVDTTELFEDQVQGFKVARQTSADASIDTLRGIYFFDASDTDKLLKFKKRGFSSPVAVLTDDDFVESNDQPILIERVQEAELLRKVTVGYLDPDAGFAVNTQTQERRSGTVKAESEITEEIPFTADADEAAFRASLKLRIPWSELHTAKFKLGMPKSSLVVGDVVEYTDKLGRNFRFRLMERGEDSGVIEFLATQDVPSVYKNNGDITGVPPLPPTPTYPGDVGDTIVSVLNIPVLRDQDDEFGYYFAAYGTGSGWGGGIVEVSTDGGATVFTTIEFEAPSGYGLLESALASEVSAEYPSQQSFTVRISEVLSSVDYESLLRYNNLAALVRADNTCEIIQYQNVTQLEADLFELSGLLRGRYNTAVDAVGIDAEFVLLDSYIAFVQLQHWMLGQTLSVRAISFGQNPDDVDWADITISNPASQTEWPVHNVTAMRDGADNVTVSWVGRGRLGVETAPRHSKYFSGYRVIYSDAVTFETQDTSHTRSSAPPGVTVQVAALNTITGQGPLSEVVNT